MHWQTITGAVVELGETDLWATVVCADGSVHAPALVTDCEAGQFPARLSVSGRLWSWGRSEVRVEGDVLLGGFLSRVDDPEPIQVGEQALPATELVGRQIVALLNLLRLTDPLKDLAVLHPDAISPQALSAIDAVIAHTGLCSGPVAWIPRSMAAVVATSQSWSVDSDLVGVIRLGTSTTEAAVWSGSIDDGDIVDEAIEPAGEDAFSEAFDLLETVLTRSVGTAPLDHLILVGGRAATSDAVSRAAEVRFGAPVLVLPSLSGAVAQRATDMADEVVGPLSIEDYEALTHAYTHPLPRREPHRLATRPVPPVVRRRQRRIVQYSVAAVSLVLLSMGAASALTHQTTPPAVAAGVSEGYGSVPAISAPGARGSGPGQSGGAQLIAGLSVAGQGGTSTPLWIKQVLGEGQNLIDTLKPSGAPAPSAPAPSDPQPTPPGQLIAAMTTTPPSIAVAAPSSASSSSQSPGGTTPSNAGTTPPSPATSPTTPPSSPTSVPSPSTTTSPTTVPNSSTTTSPTTTTSTTTSPTTPPSTSTSPTTTTPPTTEPTTPTTHTTTSQTTEPTTPTTPTTTSPTTDATTDPAQSLTETSAPSTSSTTAS